VRAETTDIVPTILDVLGADAPGDLEGASLLGSVPAGRTESRALVRGEWLTIGADLSEQREIAQSKDVWFPAGDVWALVPRPDLRSLLGRAVSDIEAVDDPGIGLELEPRGAGAAVVTGTLDMRPVPDGDALVALAGGDEIIAITKADAMVDGTARFSFLIDPDTPATSLRAWLVDSPLALRR
ncbi:MAG TPA: hypothetical protein VJ938_11135, partial [Acidimicrobiia bacterium]|nr:hypothetical protein [Acidimicrobiia bacterium]